MPEETQPLYDLLRGFDSSSLPITEDSVSEAIWHCLSGKEPSSIPIEWSAEAMAFEFCEDYPDHETGWGTYYGPASDFRGGDGQVIETPSIRGVTSQIIDYWLKRSQDSFNPVLRARYADLVWDLSKMVTGQPAHYTVAANVVDSIVEMSKNGRYGNDIGMVAKLDRALSLALGLNDSPRIEVVRDEIIAYEERIAKDSLAGTWGFAYDLLFKNKKVPITDEQKDKIVGDLEKRLDRLSSSLDTTKPDIWAAQALAIRLAGHYRTIDRPSDVRRVLSTYGAAVEKACGSSPALQASAWLQQLYSIYREYGLGDSADLVAVKLRELGPQITAEMKPISHSVSVPADKVQAHIDMMVEGDLESALRRITVYYIPNKVEVEEQLQTLSKQAPLTFRIPRQMRDHQGRSVALIGPLEDDLKGNIIRLISENMQISAPFLREVMNALAQRYSLSEKELSEYLGRSPLFREEKKLILQAGLRAYFEGDGLVAIHVLIPQIEAAVREMVELTGGAVLKPTRSGGGFHLRTFDELLRDPRVAEIVGENAALYFQLLFTDQRGWNLRNDVCHGVSRIGAFGPAAADRVVHALLCLAMVKEQNGKTS